MDFQVILHKIIVIGNEILHFLNANQSLEKYVKKHTQNNNLIGTSGGVPVSCHLAD